jgi:hypothetical protein
LRSGFVKRPTAQTESRIDASSATAHVAATMRTERPAGVYSGSGTPTATVQPVRALRRPEVRRIAPSGQC